MCVTITFFFSPRILIILDSNRRITTKTLKSKPDFICKSKNRAQPNLNGSSRILALCIVFTRRKRNGFRAKFFYSAGTFNKIKKQISEIHLDDDTR